MNDVPDLPVYGFTPDLGGLLGLAITVALPILVGLVTKQSTGAGVKATLLLALAAAKTIIEAWAQATNKGVAFDFVPVIYSTLANFGIAVALHFGLLKPAGLATKAQNTLITDKPAS